MTIPRDGGRGTGTRQDTAALAAGEFRTGPGGQTEWSAEALAVLGVADAGSEPGLELIAAQVHPDDRATFESDVAKLGPGSPIARWTRLTDLGREVRTAVVVAGLDDQGPHGFVVDVSSQTRRGERRAADDAVAKSMEARGVIEQAKGMLMVILEIDADEAFRLLRWQSTNTNTKLRSVAESLVGQLADPDLAGLTAPQRLATLDRKLAPVSAALPRPEPDGYQRRLHPEAASRLAQSEVPDLLARVVAGAGQSIAIGDSSLPGSPLMYVNDAFASLTGHPPQAILGKTCHFLQGPLTDRRAVQELGEAVWTGRPARVVLMNYRKDGSSFWNEVDLSPVRDAGGALTHVIGYQIDVTARVEREQLLHRLAYFDPETGLANRAWLTQRLADLPAEADRTAVLVRLDDDDDIPDAVNSAAQVCVDVVGDDGWLVRTGDRALLVGLPDGVATDLLASRLGSSTAFSVTLEVATAGDLLPGRMVGG